ALAGSDYQTATSRVSFSPTETSKDIDVTITDNDVYEPTETFSVMLSAPEPTGVTIADASADVFITDDDTDTRPTFSVDPLSATEGSGNGSAAFTVRLSAATSQPVTFDVAMTDGTATHGEAYPGGDDYTPPTVTTVTVLAGHSSVDVPLTITNDTVYEDTEFATIMVGLTDGETDATGAEQEAELMIDDNDAVPTISLSPDTGAEGADVPVTATITGVAQNDLTFDLEAMGVTSAGSVPAADSDYSLSPTTATIPGGTDSGSTVDLVTLSLADDTIDEPTEAVRVSAVAQDERVSTASAVFTITDDPNDLPPTLSINDKSIGESGGSVNLTVSLAFTGDTTATAKTITVPWATVAGTARGVFDYVERHSTLTIPAGNGSGTITVPIVSDTLFENNQDFTVHLGTPTPSDVTVDKADGDVTIVDDDRPTAPQLQAPASRVGAGTVTLTGTSSEGAQVQLWSATVVNPSAVSLMATTAATVTGIYSFSKIPVSTGTIFYTRANALTSSRQTVWVAQSPTLVGTATTRGAVALTVTGNPATAGQAVAIQRYLGNDQWTPVTNAGLTGAQGRYSATNTALKSGSTYTFRAIFGSTTGQGIIGGTSASIRVTVR
ncbi:MAG: hypothetical protein QOH97_4296, partial [Actinoplanes sp.]|nr:hypothetical protein [Actinoplanes sp.]